MTLQADQTEEWGTVIRAANGLTAYPQIIEAVREPRPQAQIGRQSNAALSVPGATFDRARQTHFTSPRMRGKPLRQFQLQGRKARPAPALRMACQTRSGVAGMSM
jgi:hypothetical protein